MNECFSVAELATFYLSLRMFRVLFYSGYLLVKPVLLEQLLGISLPMNCVLKGDYGRSIMNLGAALFLVLSTS